jgi:PadR family transcriptional regulator, regulatory protein PadR
MGGGESDRRSQWLRGVLDLCVLALLEEGESYGYELAQRLDSAGLGPVRGGTLYPVLLRLQRGGLIGAVWREGVAGPARKYYTLTGAGRQELRRDSAIWLAFAKSAEAVFREGEVE